MRDISNADTRARLDALARAIGPMIASAMRPLRHRHEWRYQDPRRSGYEQWRRVCYTCGATDERRPGIGRRTTWRRIARGGR